MGKNKGIAHEDIYKRCNFLYQAAKSSLEKNPSDVSMCRFYINTMTVIARRQGLHVHQDIRRTICKRCCLLMKPGVSAIYRVRNKRQKKTLLTCLGCGTIRRFVYIKDKVQFIDRPDSWVDSMVNGEKVYDQPKKPNQQQQQNQQKQKKENKQNQQQNQQHQQKQKQEKQQNQQQNLQHQHKQKQEKQQNPQHQHKQKQQKQNPQQNQQQQHNQQKKKQEKQQNPQQNQQQLWNHPKQKQENKHQQQYQQKKGNKNN